MKITIVGPMPLTVGLQPFGEAFVKTLQRPEVRLVSIAVAYIHIGCVEMVGKALASLVKRGGNVEVILGIQNSSRTAVKGLAEFIGSDRLFLFDQAGRGQFHPKLYLIGDAVNLEDTTRLHVFIGSTNLTGSGFKYNLELNIKLDMSASTDAQEISKWITIWQQLRSLPGIREYSDDLLNELEAHGVFQVGRKLIPNVEDLFSTEGGLPASNKRRQITAYIQTLLPNDFPKINEPDAVIPKLARDWLPSFWGWPKLYTPSRGGYPERRFVNTEVRFGTIVKTGYCRIYDVGSVTNFRLYCSVLRSIIPHSHKDYILMVQISRSKCRLRVLTPDDPDYADLYTATEQLPNSPKRWGYI